MGTMRRTVIWTLALGLLGLGTTVAALWHEGYHVYIVHTGSMTPTYRPGDIVIDRPSQHHYRAGEVITFRHSGLSTDVVTHRIVAITPAGLIHTKGDANRTADAWQIRPDQVEGTTITGLRGVGYLVVFLKQPAGIAAVGTAVFAIILLWSVFFGADASGPRRPATVATVSS